MARIKIRFNLGRGANYMKWKVEYPNGYVDYIDPNKCVLKLKKCSLRNNPKTANKILLGANKTVCAWILCEDLIVEEPSSLNPDESQRLRYNPRENPNWVYQGKNVDYCDYDLIESRDNKLYIIS